MADSSTEAPADDSRSAPEPRATISLKPTSGTTNQPSISTHHKDDQHEAHYKLQELSSNDREEDIKSGKRINPSAITKSDPENIQKDSDQNMKVASRVDSSSLEGTGNIAGNSPSLDEEVKREEEDTKVSPPSQVSTTAIEQNLQSATELLLRYAEILYKCTLCTTLPSILTSKTNFVSHIQSVHLTSKPHLQPCPRCLLKFGTVEDLRAHVEVTHKLRDEAPRISQKGQEPSARFRNKELVNSENIDVISCRSVGEVSPVNGDYVPKLPESPSITKESTLFSEQEMKKGRKTLPGFKLMYPGKYASTISICDQRFYYCKVCTTKFENESEAASHFQSRAHQETVDVFETGGRSYGTQRLGTSYLFPRKHDPEPLTLKDSGEAAWELSDQGLRRTMCSQSCSHDFLTSKERDGKSVTFPVSSRSKRKRSLPRPVRTEESGEDSSSSGGRSDPESNTTELSATSSSKRSPIHNDAGYSLLYSDRKRCHSVFPQNTRQHLSPQRPRGDPGAVDRPSATICYKPHGGDTDCDKPTDFRSASERESVMSFMRKVLSCAPPHNLDSYEKGPHDRRPVSESPIDMSNPMKRRKMSAQDTDETVSQCSSSSSISSPLSQKSVINEKVYSSSDRCRLSECGKQNARLMPTLDFASVLLKSSQGKCNPGEAGVVLGEDKCYDNANKGLPKVKVECQSYSDNSSSTQQCNQCGAEFPNAESFCQHFRHAHMGIAPQANTGDQQFKVLWLKQFLPPHLAVQDGGCVSRDDLLERLAGVVDAADAATWGPACNRAVRELFPDSQALRKGKFKKTYFFGVRYADGGHQEELLEDMLEEEESIDSATLRNMGQDLEKLMAHLPDVIRWSGHMDMCLSRDSLLQALSRRLGDSDVINWGMQCNRAVRQLFPEVYLRRKGKYKTTCYYGIELTGEGHKTTHVTCWPRNASGPPVVNAMDIIDTPGPANMSRLPRNAQGNTNYPHLTANNTWGYKKHPQSPANNTRGTQSPTLPTDTHTTMARGTAYSSADVTSFASDRPGYSDRRMSPHGRPSDTQEEVSEKTRSSPDVQHKEDTCSWKPSSQLKQVDSALRLTLGMEDFKYSPPNAAPSVTSGNVDNLEKLILLHPGPFVTARIFSRRFQRLVPGLEKVVYAMTMLHGRGLGQVFTLKQGNSKVFFKSVPSKSLEMPLGVLGVRLIDYQVMFHERDPKLEDTLHDKLKAFYPQLDLLSSFYKY